MYTQEEFEKKTNKNSEELEGCIFDILDDFLVYLNETRLPCKHCDGKGKYEGTSNRDIAIALLVSLGVKTNVQVFGDDCLYCEGTGVDLSESLKEVKSKMSSFWVKEIQDIFQTNK